MYNTPEIVYPQGYQDKARLFEQYLPVHKTHVQAGEEALAHLVRLCPDAAHLFAPKPNLLDVLTLRLINGETASPPPSYYALSYCWSKRELPDCEGGYPVPISAVIFSHIACQRETADQGVWIDQICINQNDEVEKSATISAMDALYTCASMVVVVLDDIEVTAEEEAFLREFIKDYEDASHPPIPLPYMNDSPCYMEKHPVLKNLFFKICRARWFTRAWCSHEIRLSRHSIFLIRCSSDPLTVLQLADYFLGYLTALSSLIPKPEDILMVAEVLQRIVDYAGKLDRLCQISKLNKIPPMEVTEPEKVMPYSMHIREIFQLGAGGNPRAKDPERDANLDRITILLNTVGPGLAIDRQLAANSRWTVTSDSCQALLLLLALTDGDATSLCAMGAPFELSYEGPSWLRRPEQRDIGAGSYRHKKMPRMDISHIELDNCPAMQWIRMPMVDMGHAILPHSEWTKTACSILKSLKTAGLGGGHHGLQAVSRPGYYGWRYQTDVDAFLPAFVATVALILECGPKWMLGMASKCGLHTPDMSEIKDGIRRHFPDGFDRNYLESQDWVASGSHAVEAIVRIAHWMVSWSLFGLPAHDRLQWMPRGYSFNTNMKAIAFVPSPTVQLFIPLPLFCMEYSRFGRIWVIESRGERMFVETKCVLYSNFSESNYQSVLQAGLPTSMTMHGASKVSASLPTASWLGDTRDFHGWQHY